MLCMRDSVGKEVAGTLDCSMRQPGKVWLQIRADLFMGFFSLSMKTEVTSDFLFHQCKTRGTKLKLCFLLLSLFFLCFVFICHNLLFLSLTVASCTSKMPLLVCTACNWDWKKKNKFCKMKHHIGNISRLVICPFPPLPTPPDPTLCFPSKPVFD